MGSSVYTINKGINRPIEFRGLKAQYIGYLAGGLLILLVLFAGLYLLGVHPFFCVGLILLLGAALFTGVHRMNRKYGVHGLMKKAARRRVPSTLKSYSRKLFLKNYYHATGTGRDLADSGGRA